MPAMTEVGSSNIYAIGHDPNTNTLHVQFRSAKDKRMPGAAGSYANVTPEQHQDLMASDSKGSWMAEHLKANSHKHPYTKR